ncbi:MAG: VanW family protein [Roseburia sp.]|nr:VanW family protein [Roseburia sp.]
MRKIRVILSLACFAVAASMFFGMYFQVNAKSNDKQISEGIYIESIYIGGMSQEEAEATLAEYISELNNKKITFTAGDRQLDFVASELGISVANNDIVKEAMAVGKTGSLLTRYKDLRDLKHGDLVLDLDIRIDSEVVTSLLNDNISKIDTKAVNNSLRRENGEFIYVEGTTGISVNVGPSVALIEEYISDEWNRDDAVIELSAQIVEPKGSEAELAQVKDLLGGYHTNFKTSVAARITNINVATSRINGTVLYPGDEFSVNETILYRNKENGYEKAGSYEGGQTVQTYGGGVCQVSTTLYNAVILSELEITDRRSHSMTVAYVPLSMDAMIADGIQDFKFKNNTEYPIYLEGYTEGKDLYFNIYGVETRPANRTIEFESVVISSQDPGTTFVAAELPVGTVTQTQSKHIGYKTQLWKIVKEDGVVVSRDLFNTSSYKSSPKVLAIGIATDNENLRWAIYNAIATGDAATISSALYAVSPEAAAAVMQ